MLSFAVGVGDQSRRLFFHILCYFHARKAISVIEILFMFYGGVREMVPEAIGRLDALKRWFSLSDGVLLAYRNI